MQKSAPAQAIRPAPPHARQQVLLHAVVGSLVLCAVLVPPAVQPSVLAAPEQSAARPEVNTNKFRHVPPQPVRGDNTARVFPRRSARDQFAVVVLNNMTASANGKRLIARPGLSSAAAGNLLPQHLSIP
jgi:hypothetical protein